MKVSNIHNLTEALKNKEAEIEVHGDFSDSVIKAALSSSVLHIAGTAAMIALSVSVLSGILYLSLKLRFLMILAVVLVLAALFAAATLFTMVFTQRISLSLSLKLRRYSVNKHNDIVVLKLKPGR